MNGKIPILTLVAGVALGLLALGGAWAADTMQATYVGGDVCADCHDDVASHLEETQHGMAAFGMATDHGCEACHGPGSLHVEDPDIEENRPTLSDKPADEQSAVCLGCHQKGAQLFWSGSEHDTRGLACTDCHSVHDPISDSGQLKSATAMEQCFTCHKDVRAQIWKTSHHPIREGKVACNDCHNPHGAQSPKMVNAASINDQCYSCHAEKRGPFLWEHPPVRENCMNCHVPHGSNHIKLQRTSVPFICQQCHANTRHPGTLYDGFRLPTLEDESTGSNRIFNRACLDCHAAIHGSNHPSSPYLGH